MSEDIAKVAEEGAGAKVVPAKPEELRIGVFVCHCGLNIAGSVDVKDVTKFAATLPHVAYAEDNRYTCSDPGQDSLKKAVKEYNLNRVVVASCSPRMHEPTFRTACEEAGLNKYLFEMANIRDQCSWVHLYEKEEGTEKAKDLVKMAVAKAALLKPAKELEVPIIRKALVVGGGVAGIQAALDLGDAGFKTYIVEKEPSIGGRMAQIDKTFPTVDCSICILGPKMSDAGRHPNIELLTYSEITDVHGYIGNFAVTVKKRPRYVLEDLCNGCSECFSVCPVEAPNAFDDNVAPRHAIYMPFPQAVPSLATIDIDHCIKCYRCAEICGRDAIDFTQEEEEVILEVGTIIIATGVDAYDPTPLKRYGYAECPNVITSLEFERLINAGGPSKGHLLRPSDKEIPKSVAFIQCVGSRSEVSGHRYCSNICCMNTLKDSLLIKEHWPDTKIYVFYIDIRAFGKGFEDLYKNVTGRGVTFIRSLPSQIFEDKKTHNLRLVGENTLLSEPYKLETEMVILSVGIQPRKDSGVIQRLFNLSKTSDGFFMESNPILKPVDAPTGGVFFAGCAEGPKDIKTSVMEAGAAASHAAILMGKGKVTVEAITPEIIEDMCIGCGLCEKVCPFNAIFVNEETKKAEVIEAACSGCGTCGAECPQGAIISRHFTDDQIYAQIDAATDTNADKKIVAFCCNWCSYAGADNAGVSRIQYPTSVRIIRTMCSGRIRPQFIEHAFKRGVAAVLVAGCHLGDCHYIDANYQTEKRVNRLWRKMEKQGLDKERLQLVWVSAAEGEKFAEKIREMQKIIDNVSKEAIEKAKAVFSKKKKKKVQKKKVDEIATA